MAQPAELGPGLAAATAATASPRWRQLLWGGGLLVLWALLVASILTPLAFTRHFHVDEIQVAYNAALLGYHRLPGLLNFRVPMVVGLSWIAAAMETSWTTLLEMRAVFFVLFVGDLLMVAMSAPRLVGLPARAAALLAFTLVEPFWRHGFEIRHDVLMLTGSLALFWLSQRAASRGLGLGSALAAGAVAGLMQVNSLKAVVVWLPALLLLFVLAVARHGPARLGSRVAATAAGFALAVATGLALVVASGVAVADLGQMAASFVGNASEAHRFSAGSRVGALLRELPHLAALAAVCVFYAGWSLRGRWREEVASLVTAAWLAIEGVALVLNPTPFTYNLIHVVPFLFLAALDGVVLLCRRWPRARLPVLGATAAATVIAFGASWRGDVVGHTSGAPQRSHCEAAEALTGREDSVLDGAGLVLSRRPPGRDWMLHSLSMPAYRRGELRKVRQLLAQDPAPVLLTNYRWRWLEREDLMLVRAHYVAVAPHLLVLGGRAEGASGSFTIARRGRYVIQTQGDLGTLRVDDLPLRDDGIVTLDAGSHRWRGSERSGLAWAWLGPRLAALPPPPPSLVNGDLFISD